MKNKLIEINVKNKKHLACCTTIKQLTQDVEKTIDHMNNLQQELSNKYNVPANVKESLSKHIKEMETSKKELYQKSEICGCT